MALIADPFAAICAYGLKGPSKLNLSEQYYEHLTL
jgi:hypothetical protein